MRIFRLNCYVPPEGWPEHRLDDVFDANMIACIIPNDVENPEMEATHLLIEGACTSFGMSPEEIWGPQPSESTHQAIVEMTPFQLLDGHPEADELTIEYLKKRLFQDSVNAELRQKLLALFIEADDHPRVT